MELESSSVSAEGEINPDCTKKNDKPYMITADIFV